jgi:hypothetical protein
MVCPPLFPFLKRGPRGILDRGENANSCIPIMVWLARVLAGVGLSALAILVSNVFGRPSGRRKECAKSAGGDFGVATGLDFP